MYQLQRDPYGEISSVILFRGDFRIGVPFVEGNTDYQEYLAWLAEGNEPLPADEPPTG